MDSYKFYLSLFISLYKKFISYIIVRNNSHNSVNLILNKEHFYKLCFALKEDSNISSRVLNDICIVDLPDRPERFEINYNFLSIKNNFRIFLKTYTNAYIPSISTLFRSAN